MRRILLLLISIVLAVPVAIVAMQDAPPLRFEITGVNPTGLPTVVVTTSVFDRLGQPIFGLSQENFAVTGELADTARIVSVENVTDDNLAFSVVLAIDTSSSMAGYPLDRAKEAAVTFINSIGPNDPIALVTFDTTEELIVDYTTNKDVLINAINNLGYGGRTALYDGSTLAIETASRSPTTRRVVILLSDGAEFGGNSSSVRTTALDTAVRDGVSVYTIGLGFGIDRSYLQDLSRDTNAQFFESPTADELVTIYGNLAATLRSFYVITLEADIPADGNTYTLELQATDAGGNTATATADLRAPIPVPIVSLGGIPEGEISEVTDITADVAADDAITVGEFQIDGASVAILDSEPYTVTIDPALLSPGGHDLSFSATDESGDVGTVSQTIQIAALPSTASIVGLPEGEISEAVDVTLDVTGQTPGVSADYNVDGGESTTVSEAPFTFTVNPYDYEPGDHTLNVALTNAGGVSSTAQAAFSVASLPPQFEITGIEADQVIGDPTTVTLDVQDSQSPISTIQVAVGDTNIAEISGSSNASFEIDPAAFPFGPQTLTVTVSEANGQVTTQTLDFETVDFTPKITLSGVDAGETIDEDRTVAVEVVSQSPVTAVVYKLDGVEIGTQSEAPFSVDLNIAEVGSGSHILTVDVTNESGRTASEGLAFTVFAPTNTPVPSNTPTAGPSNTPTEVPPTATPTVDLTLTADVVAQAQAAGTSTADAQVQELMTEQAVSAVDAQSTLDAQATNDAQSTLDAQATDVAQETANARATSDVQAQANAQATNNARATSDAQEALDAEQTANARATSDVMTTANAQAALDAQGTLDARATSTAEARATSAQATLNAQATEEVTAEPTEDETTVAQVPNTPTGEATLSGSPAPSLTPPELTTETQGAAADNSNILPIVVCIAGAILLLIVLFLVMRGRRQDQNQQRR